MNKILIAPNSFKESADAKTVACLFEKYLSRFLPQAHYEFITKPISDGGDGFLSVCEENFGLTQKSIEISNPYSEEKIKVDYGYSKETKTVYLESAKILGMEIIPAEERKPLKLSSKGLGEVLFHLKNLSEKKELIIDKVTIGIGGTGTSDLGLGALSKFGLKIFDDRKKSLEVIPENFIKASKLEFSETKLPFEIETIVDVDNPLLGESGAAKIFAPQKGADPDEVEIIESGFINILDLLKVQESERDNLSGAGGGLAAGLILFFDAKLKYSKNFILDDLNINKKNINPDFIITGEGSFDYQSLMDKGPAVILQEYKNSAAPMFLCAGKIKEDFAEENFKNVYFLELKKYFSDEKESMENIEKGIEFISKEIVQKIQKFEEK